MKLNNAVKNLLVASGIALIAGTANAEYQKEAYGTYSVENYDVIDFSTIEFGGSYYLQPVTEHALFGESAFLDKASYINGHYASTSWDWDYVGYSFSTSYSNISIGGRYVLEEGNKPYIIEGGIGFGDLGTLSIAGGMYLDDDTEVLVGLVSTDSVGSGGGFGGFAGSLQGDMFFGRYKTLMSVLKYDNVVVQATAMLMDGDLGGSVFAEHYLNDNMSVGVETGLIFAEDLVMPVAVSSKYKISDQLIAEGSLGVTDLFEFNMAFAIGVRGRF